MLTKEILQEMLDTGIVLAGAKKCGKSNASKVFASEIVKEYPNIQVRIFDTCQNWVHGFEPVLCQKINDETRYLYTGKRNVLYDIELMDIEKIMDDIGKIVSHDYNEQRLLKTQNKMERWIVYFIEEAQNVLGTYSLSRESGKLWIKMISEGRNFNMAFVFIGQRMADISTKVIERANGYLFGRTSGDNDRKKINRIVGNATISTRLENEEWIRLSGNKISEEISTLNTGEFIYFNGKEGRFIKFPNYVNASTPIPLSTEVMGI